MSFLRIRILLCYLSNKVAVKVNIDHILTWILCTKISCLASCNEWCGQVVFNSTVAHSPIDHPLWPDNHGTKAPVYLPEIF